MRTSSSHAYAGGAALFASSQPLMLGWADCLPANSNNSAFASNGVACLAECDCLLHDKFLLYIERHACVSVGVWLLARGMCPSFRKQPIAKVEDLLPKTSNKPAGRLTSTQSARLHTARLNMHSTWCCDSTACLCAQAARPVPRVCAGKQHGQHAPASRDRDHRGPFHQKPRRRTLCCGAEAWAELCSRGA